MELEQMNRQDMRERIEELLEELAQVEQQQEDTTLSHSDQQLLDQAWEDLNDQIALIQEAIEMGEEINGAYEDEWQEFEDEEADKFDPSIQSHTIQKVYHKGAKIYVDKEERKAAEYYETDFGVYYNAADEV